MYISESRIINKNNSPYCVTIEMYNAYDIIQESTAEINREFAIINYLIENSTVGNSTDKKGIINKVKKFIETIIQKIKTIWSVVSKAINKAIDQIKIKLNTGGNTKGEFKGNIPQYITYKLYDWVELKYDVPSVSKLISFIFNDKDIDFSNRYTDVNKYIDKETTVEIYSNEMKSRTGLDNIDDLLNDADHKVNIKFAKRNLKNNLEDLKKADASVNKEIDSILKLLKKHMDDFIEKKKTGEFLDDAFDDIINKYKYCYEKMSMIADNYKKLIVEILKDINHSVEQFNQIPV